MYPQVLLITALSALPIPQESIRLEAEEAQLVGVAAENARPGFSGKGYVTGFDKEGDRITFTVRAKAGLYAVKVGYSAPHGEKGYDLNVNGGRISGMFPPTASAFASVFAGKVELKAGENTLVLEKGWGYFDIDYLELTPARPAPPPQKPPLTLADRQATPKTRALMRYLVDLYGDKTLSGQYGEEDSDYILRTTGRAPAIFGGDFMDYSPSRIAYGANPEGLTERFIRRARAGHILTLMWHWNAPSGLRDKTYTDSRGQTIDARWYKGFYTNATTFDVQRALADPRSEDYRLILRDIDAIAAQLRKLANADIPVLWRPLHEADGRWFWWGAKGSEPFRKLWRLMFDRLTRYHGLHNLIWVYTGFPSEWYPGDDLVDIIGMDSYPGDPGDPLSGTWESLQQTLNGRKLLALTEFGGVPDIEKMLRFGVRWSFFLPWVGDLGPRKMSASELKRIFSQDRVITLEELPAKLRAHSP
jgi:mannan endo-1,4-beta-mannosidase